MVSWQATALNFPRPAPAVKREQFTFIGWVTLDNPLNHRLFHSHPSRNYPDADAEYSLR